MGQFTGGQGSGNELATLNSAFACGFFFGGEYSGYDTAQVRSSTWDCAGLYLGDTASGYSQSLVPSTQNCIFFLGEQGSGYSQAIRPSTFNCVSFTGSQGQGYSLRSALDDNSGSCVTILRVEASPLRAEWDAQGQARLSWQTFAEPDNEGFEIWKSGDGLDWQRLDWLPAQGRAQFGADYQYTDWQSPQRLQYYRYLQMGFDGLGTWSNVVVLEQDKTPSSPRSQWTVFPNPVSGQAQISLRAWDLEPSAQVLRWRLINALGQNLRQGQAALQAPESLLQIPLQDLGPGLYYLGLDLGQGQAPVFLPLRVF